MSIMALGIDVGKANLHVCLMAGKQYQGSEIFENTAAGHQLLVNWLIKQGGQSAHICLEATGQYGYCVAVTLNQREFDS